MAEDIIKNKAEPGTEGHPQAAPTTKEVTEAIKQSKWGWFWGRLPENKEAKKVEEKKEEKKSTSSEVRMDEPLSEIDKASMGIEDA